MMALTHPLQENRGIFSWESSLLLHRPHQGGLIEGTGRPAPCSWRDDCQGLLGSRGKECRGLPLEPAPAALVPRCAPEGTLTLFWILCCLLAFRLVGKSVGRETSENPETLP